MPADFALPLNSAGHFGLTFRTSLLACKDFCRQVCVMPADKVYCITAMRGGYRSTIKHSQSMFQPMGKR